MCTIRLTIFKSKKLKEEYIDVKQRVLIFKNRFKDL